MLAVLYLASFIKFDRNLKWFICQTFHLTKRRRVLNGTMPHWTF